MFTRNNSVRSALIFFGLVVFTFCGCEKEKIRIIGEPAAELQAPTEMAISWETDIPGNSIVDWGETTDLDSTTVDEEERQLHNVVLAGLKANTTYYYKVSSKSSQTGTTAKSDLGEFSTGENEESITLKGWVWFSQGELDSAQTYFEKALSQNDEYTWAYVGRGWVQLKKDAVLEALTDFNSGLNFNSTQLDGRTGRAAIHLSLSDYNSAIQDGIYVLETDPEYVFEYDTSIDFHDVLVLLAQAYYAKEDFEAAQAQCDILDPDNGLDVALPSTWIVNGTDYETYLLALINLINYLDSLY